MWWILALSLTLDVSAGSQLPDCWLAARRLHTLMKEDFSNTLKQQRLVFFPFDGPRRPLAHRLKTTEMQNVLFNLDRPPERHHLVLKHLAMAAFLDGDHLQAGIFHAWSFKRYQNEGYADEIQDQAYAAALSFYVVYEETQNERVGRLAADYFVRAGFLETAAKIYEGLGDPGQAERIRQRIPDRVEISRSQPTASAAYFRNSRPRQIARVLNAEVLSALQVFELPVTATPDEITNQFRRRIKVLHPAVAGSDEYDEAALIRVIEAKAVLKKFGYI